MKALIWLVSAQIPVQTSMSSAAAWKTKRLFHFQSSLANLISGVHTIQNLDEKNSVPGRLSGFYSSVSLFLVVNSIFF